MRKYINCNLCGGDNAKVIFTKEEYNIVQCSKCGLVYMNPCLCDEEILEKVRYGESSSGHKKIVWYNAKLNLFKTNLKTINKYSSKGRLLDIGCGYGAFLKLAKDDGWSVDGIEIARLACNYVEQELGIKIHNNPLRETGFPDDYFDVVTLWEVLDLFFDPSAELKEVNRIMKCGGTIAMRIYNVGFHVFLEKILKKTGFCDIKVVPSCSTSGDPYSTGGVLGKWGVVIIKMIIDCLSFAVYYLTFKKVIISSAILVFANKPSR